LRIVDCGLIVDFGAPHFLHSYMGGGRSDICRAAIAVAGVWWAKMGVGEEELDESLLWLDLLFASNERVPADQIKRLAAEADELLAMTVQSIRTARGGSR
jgi:hypothetical protein